MAAAFVFFHPPTIVERWDRARTVMAPAESAQAFASCLDAWAGAHLGDDVDYGRLAQLEQKVIEAASPANNLSTNPELLELTRAESGANLVRGFQHWLEDAQHAGADGGQLRADAERQRKHGARGMAVAGIADRSPHGTDESRPGGGGSTAAAGNSP